MIEKKEIQKLRKSKEKILKSKKFKKNPQERNWHRLRNPLVQAFNYMIMLFCKILPPCRLKNSLYGLTGMKIGKNVSIGNECLFDTIFPNLIVIEDGVSLGWGVTVFTHEFSKKDCRIGSVIIKENAMVGEYSTIRPGITIGKDSMVGAMSFVNKDVKPKSKVGGVPIRKIE